MSEYDAIIIGAGAAGLSAGALLADAGKKVLVLEKEENIGGRVFSKVHKGHCVDIHMVATAGNLEKIYAKLNKPYPKLTPYTEMLCWEQGKWVNVMEGMDRKVLRNIIQEVAAYSYDDLEKYDDVSLKDWLSARTDNERIHNWIKVVAWGSIVAGKYEDISAGEFFVFLKQPLENKGALGGHFAMVDEGTEALLTPLADVIKEKGGEIRTNTRVRNIIIENGQACGVEFEVGEKIVPAHFRETEVIRASNVICTLPLWDVLKVLPTDQLPLWYVDWIKRIQHKISVMWITVCALDQPLKGFEDQRVMGTIGPEYTRTDRYLSLVYSINQGPPGEAQAVFWCMGNYDEFPNYFELGKPDTHEQAKKIFELCEEDIHEFFPDIKDHLLWKYRQISPWSTAELPGHVGMGRPGMQPPGVKNLYLVGDSIREGRGNGVQSAAFAGSICVDRILGGQ